MNKQKLLKKILNSRQNIRFNELITLIEAFGFKHMRAEGSHNIYKHEKVGELINIQNVKGEAKPYQIKQFLALVEKYNLKLEEDES